MNFPQKFSMFALSFVTCSALATDYQDLWWQPTESGWGVNIAQQYDIMFATWFIYNPDRTPLWLSMSRGERINANTFSGPLYITGGPGFSGTFNPALVSVTQVGNATFTFSDAKNGILNYTVNGVNVSKNITRESFREIPISGTYYGSAVTAFNGCSFTNGSYTINEVITVSGSGNGTGTGNNIVIREQSGGTSCDSVGTYSQFGSMFQGSGTYTCNDGTSGTWVSPEMRATENSFVAKMETQSGACRGVGVIGGVK